MKICLVGHYVQRPDEGVRKIAYHLAQELGRRHELRILDIWDVSAWVDVKAFRPEVIHYVLSPTLAGLVVAKLLSLAHRPAATVMSAPHPALGFLGRWLSLARPDVTLVQAHESEARFQASGFKTEFLPNGVNTDRFVPVTGAAKERLREKYRIEKDKFVVLHVASLKPGRNLQRMAELQGETTQVLVVGRPSERKDSRLAQYLGEQGCIVWSEYSPWMEEIYGLSDCYVFPTIDRRYGVEMPLSVLEAMSCNLPVITTKFGALPRVFEDGDGLIFVEQEEELAQEVAAVRCGLKSKTRDKVLPYSWAWIAERLSEVYQRLVSR